VPSIANLELICEALGLTLSQFFADEETFAILTEEETDFLNDYRKLPPDIKKTLIDMVNSITRSI
jgi:hypothetical protein